MPKGELLESGIRGKLHRLWLLLRIRLVGEGAAWVLVALVGLVFVTLGFDYLLHLDRPLRVTMLLLCAVGVACVGWRELISPLLVPADSGGLALLVENRNPSLGDRLIGALQFERMPDVEALGMSRSMVQRMAAEAGAIAAPLGFGGVLSWKRMWWAMAAAGLSTAMLGGMCLWRGDIMMLWFNRNVALSNVDWPQETYLSVVGGPDFAVLRGDDLAVTIAADEGPVAPPYVVMHARYPSVGWTEQRVDRDAGGRYVRVFRTVTEEFEFYVTGGDDERDKRRPHRVTLIDPPGLVDVRFEITPPGYTRKPTTVVRASDVSGVIPVPIGSRVKVVGASNKDLVSAVIVLEGKRISPEMRILATTGADGSELTRTVVGAFEVGGANKAQAHMLRFALKDTGGFTNRGGRQLIVQVVPDEPPRVSIRKRSVGAVLTPSALVPLTYQADDAYGLEVVRFSGAAGDAKPVPLGKEVPAAPGQEPTLAGQTELEIQAMALEPGQVLRIRAEADDTLPEDLGGPNTGTSGALTFRIVKPEELMNELIRRQKELRLEFVEAIALQEGARAKTADASVVFAAGEVTAGARAQLADSARFQRSVGAEIAKVADSFEAIAEEMRYNRLPADHAALSEGLVGPLRELTEPIERAVADLEATKELSEVGKLSEQARRLATAQQDIRGRMEEILQRMQKIESRQELANQLQLIIKWSGELLTTIKERQEERTGDVFDRPTTRPDDDGD